MPSLDFTSIKSKRASPYTNAPLRNRRTAVAPTLPLDRPTAGNRARPHRPWSVTRARRAVDENATLQDFTRVVSYPTHRAQPLSLQLWTYSCNYCYCYSSFYAFLALLEYCRYSKAVLQYHYQGFSIVLQYKKSKTRSSLLSETENDASCQFR